MRCAIDICPSEKLSDPRAIVRLARAAEESGWDGLSDLGSVGPAMDTVAADPFVALTAVALRATSRLRLITSIVALARRRPQLVVQAAATLDLASEGRLILGLGAGEDEPDFTAFGEDYERAARIARMDEALAIVDAGLRGERLEHEGPLLVARRRRHRAAPAAAASAAHLAGRHAARRHPASGTLGGLDRRRHLDGRHVDERHGR